MTQGNIIAIVVVVLLLAAGAWYVLSTPNPNGTPASTASSTNNSQTGTQSTETLRSVTAHGGNYTCTLGTIQGSAVTRGNIYSSGGETRLDFVDSNNGIDVTIHVIRNGSFSYTWVDGQTVGTKTAITSSSPILKQPTGGVIAVTDTAQVSTDCRPWVPDTTKFTLPTGITFSSS